MTPFQSIKTCLRKAFVFSGRATRSEYWWFLAATLIATLLLAFGDIYLIGKDIYEETYSFWPLSTIGGIAMALPMAAVGARRLQDVGFYGWPAPLAEFLLWVDIFWTIGRPVEEDSMALWVGSVIYAIIMIACVFPSRPNDNRFGPPLEGIMRT